MSKFREIRNEILSMPGPTTLPYNSVCSYKLFNNFGFIFQNSDVSDVRVFLMESVLTGSMPLALRWSTARVVV